MIHQKKVLILLFLAVISVIGILFPVKVGAEEWVDGTCHCTRTGSSTYCYCTFSPPEEGGGGGTTHYPATPWLVQGYKHIYKNSGDINAVRSALIRVDQDIDTVGLTASTTGNNNFSYSIDKIYWPDGNARDLLDDLFVFSTSTPTRWDAFATFDTHIMDNPLTLDLVKAGGTLNLDWYYVGPPTNLRALCNENGTTATLNWTNGTAMTSYAVRAIKTGNTLVCDAGANGPISICRDVTTNSTAMNVTPNASYSWWVNPESFDKAYAASAFTCGPSPSGFLHSSDPSCPDFSNRYQVGQSISHTAYVQSDLGLGNSKLLIAKESGNSLTMYGYTPSWCSASGGTMIMSGGYGIFCQIESRNYSGQTQQQTYGAQWTPTEAGVYYAVINVASSNPDIFACSSNPLCEYSPSPLAKYTGNYCNSIRFSACQHGSLANRMQDLTINLNTQGGELIRMTVVPAGTCDGPKPICGKVTLPNGSGVSGKPVTISSTAGVTRIPSTTVAGTYSNTADFVSGSTYSVSLGGTPPSGYYAPLIPSITGQKLGGTPNCAANCSNANPINTCDFVYRSCTDLSAISDITMGPNPILFVPQSGSYQQVPITWSQETALKATSFTLTLAAGGQTIAEKPIVPSSTATGLNTFYTYNLTSDDLDSLHAFIYAKDFTGTSDDITITVKGTRLADATYCASYPVSKTKIQTVNSTEQVKIRVRQSPDTNTCTIATLSPLTEITGALWKDSDAEPAPDNTDKTIIVSTGAPITAKFKFTSHLFDCNTNASSCKASEDVLADPTKTCITTVTHADTSGNVTTYVSRLNLASWWQAVGGLVYSKNTLENNLPITNDGNPILCLETLSEAQKKVCRSYVVRSPNYFQDAQSGLPVSPTISSFITGWLSERKQGVFPNEKTNQSAGASANLETIASVPWGTGTPHAYFKTLVERKAPISSGVNLNAFNPITTNSGFYSLPSGSFTYNKNTLLTIPADKSFIFFLSGDLTIQNAGNLGQQIVVNPGGFFAIIVDGKITIDSTVGTPIYSNAMPTWANGVGQDTALTKANLSGIFIADDLITIEKNGTTPDKRFIGEGSFISAAGFNLPRKYSYPLSPYSYFLAGFTPTELFRHRPDLVLNTPKELKENLIQYQEIN